MNLSPGDRVDRYVLREPLGEGGQGAVWKAEDPLAGGAFVAIKLVSVAGTRPSDAERLRREARALARLSHPSLLKSHALFEDLGSGVLGIVMDYVEGSSLRAAHTDERFTSELGVAALAHIAGALAYVHETGVTHRDLKLENVLVTSSFWSQPTDPPNVKLVDFGIAKDIGAQHPLTALDTVIGTLAYLAPELIDPGFFSGQTSAPAVDVFAFGVLAYKMLVGGHPSGLAVNASIVDYAAAYRHAAQGQPDTPWPKRIGRGPWTELIRDCLVLNQSARLSDGKELAQRIAGISPTTANLVSEIPDDEPPTGQSTGTGGAHATSLASPRAVLAPTQALVAVPGRAEPMPLAPGHREAPTAPLGAGAKAVEPPVPEASGIVPPAVHEPSAQSGADATTHKPVSLASAAVEPAERASVSDTPSRQRSKTPRSLVWAAVGTIASVVGVMGYRLAVHGDDRPPDPLTSLPSAAASVTKIAPADKPDEPVPEAGGARTLPDDCDATAGPCPCCPSGRDCGGPCGAPLTGDARWALTLKQDGSFDRLLERYPKAQICARIARSGEQPHCSNVRESVTGGTPPTILEVSGEQFERYGLDLLVQDPADGGRVPTPLARVEVEHSAVTRLALCRGLDVDAAKQSEQIDRFVFYLDTPGKIPHRCNLP